MPDVHPHFCDYADPLVAPDVWMRNLQHTPRDCYAVTLPSGTAVPPFALSMGTTRDTQSHLAIADEEGFVSVVDTATPDRLRFVDKFLVHHNAIFDIRWMYRDSCSLVTGSGDQTARIVDLSRRSVRAALVGHGGSIRAVEVAPTDPHIVATVGRDGCLCLFDLRVPSSPSSSRTERSSPAPSEGGPPQHLPVMRRRCLHGPHTRRSSRASPWPEHSISSVASVRGFQLLATGGASDGLVKLWDLRRGATTTKSASSTSDPVWVLEEGETDSSRRKYGITHLETSRDGRKLLAVDASHRIRVIQTRLLGSSLETRAAQTLRGLQVQSFYVRATFSADSSTVVSGSSDGNGYLWHLPRRRFGGCAARLPDSVLPAGPAEVSVVAWRRDNACVATASDDGIVKTWHPCYATQPKEPQGEAENKASRGRPGTVVAGTGMGVQERSLATHTVDDRRFRRGLGQRVADAEGQLRTWVCPLEPRQCFDQHQGDRNATAASVRVSPPLASDDSDRAASRRGSSARESPSVSSSSPPSLAPACATPAGSPLTPAWARRLRQAADETSRQASRRQGFVPVDVASPDRKRHRRSGQSSNNMDRLGE